MSTTCFLRSATSGLTHNSWGFHEYENTELSSKMITNAYLAQNIVNGQITLHSNNGGPMKGATMQATLQRLGVVPSYSRPSVSNDNPFQNHFLKH